MHYVHLLTLPWGKLQGTLGWTYCDVWRNKCEMPGEDEWVIDLSGKPPERPKISLSEGIL